MYMHNQALTIYAGIILQIQLIFSVISTENDSSLRFRYINTCMHMVRAAEVWLECDLSSITWSDKMTDGI